MNRCSIALRSWVAVLLAATATVSCASSGDGDAQPSASTAEQPRQGGTIVVAIGEPVCADWYGQCGASNFGVIALQTLPIPLKLINDEYQVSDLLTGEPTVDAGPPQRVTYRINPQAVWSDGTPITSADFKYTWEQGGPNNVRGMGDIAAVDDADPRTAIVTWREPKANWRDRFRPILPKHLLDGKDRNAEMKDGYRFSGGPWMLDHWTRGQEFKIVRNPRYWGNQTHLDAVVGRVVPDPGAARAAYKSGQLDMITQGPELGIEEMKAVPDTAFEPLFTPNFSFIALNTQRPPLDRKAVRQALGYATDRDALVTQLQGHIRPGVRPLQAVASESNRQLYGEPFARYRRDLARVNDLMRADGWAKGSDGIWTLADQRASIELTIDGVARFHALFGQIVSSQWKEAGFDVSLRPVSATALISDVLPKGTYQATFSGSAQAGGVSADPGQCVRFCSRSIPTEASRFTGGNVTRIVNPAIDDVWGRVDTELDPAKRTDLVRRGQELLAEEVPVLPLTAIIDVYVFNTRKIGGPVAVGPALVRLPEWFCRTTCG